MPTENEGHNRTKKTKSKNNVLKGVAGRDPHFNLQSSGTQPFDEDRMIGRPVGLNNSSNSTNSSKKTNKSK